MRRKIYFAIAAFLLAATAVTAYYGNIELYGYYNITNASWITAKNFSASEYYIGNGSLLTDIDAGNTTEEIRTAVDADTNASTECSAGEFLDGGGPCRSINETIDNRTASVTYNATNVTTRYGTWTDGDLASVQTPEDALSWNVTEGTGAYPVLTIDINFTGVTDFDTVIGRIWYVGGAGHAITLQIWRTDIDEWENYEDYTDMTGFVNIHVPVYDPVDHIDAANNVSIRFDHADTGLPTHAFYIDYIALVEGWTAVTTSDHDGLGGRDRKESNRSGQHDGAVVRG